MLSSAENRMKSAFWGLKVPWLWSDENGQACTIGVAPAGQIYSGTISRFTLDPGSRAKARSITIPVSNYFELPPVLFMWRPVHLVSIVH
jgi:hypothetical protein